MAEVERSQGYVDALRELSLLVDFEKIDSIFEAFLTTNEHWGSHASARDVIGRMREFNTYYIYKHDNIRYCAKQFVSQCCTSIYYQKQDQVQS